jgi:hypothetical protein
LFEVEGVVVVEDPIGRPAITCEDAGRLIGSRRAARAYQESEWARQMAEAAARYPVPGGVPAVEGLTAVEQVLLAGEGDRPVRVFEELLDIELAHGKGT